MSVSVGDTQRTRIHWLWKSEGGDDDDVALCRRTQDDGMTQEVFKPSVFYFLSLFLHRVGRGREVD